MGTGVMDADRPNLPPEEILAHAVWVRRLAGCLVADPAVAEDLVQETWLAALRRPPGDPRRLRGWLARVLRNQARQHRRSEGRRRAREAGRDDGREGPSPAEALQRLEALRAVADELAELAEPYRSSLLLRFHEGLEPAEIARRQGLPGGTVRWRLKRGLELLRERLEARHGGREEWLGALWPLLGGPAAGPAPPGIAPGAPGAAAEASVPSSSALLLPGALAVKKLVLASAAAAVLVAGSFVLATTREDPREGRGVAEVGAEVPVALAAPPRSPAPPRGELAGVAEEANARREVAAGAPPAPAGEPPPAAVDTTARIRLRVVDEELVPLQGARVLYVGGSMHALHRVHEGDRQAAAVSRRDGGAELSLRLGPPPRARVVGSPPTAGPQSIELLVSHAGRAHARVEAFAAPGDAVHIGDVVLGPGGSVSGRVVDEDGAGLAGAWVQPALDPELRSSSRSGRRDAAALGADPALAVRTSTDGAFRLEGVPVGYARVWAGSEGRLASLSGTIEVREGEESPGIELRLEPLGPSDVIEGVVLDPSGRPVPGARLHFEVRGRGFFGGSASGSRSAGEDGRFRWIVPMDGVYRLVASDVEGRHAAASLEGVDPGAGEVELRLGELARLVLAVEDERGDPVPSFLATILDPEEAPRPVHAFATETSDRTARGEHGRAELRTPRGTFSIEVRADGYDLELLGPFEGDAPPEELRCTLRSLPGVRGRVLHGGEPLEGASVSLVRPARHYLEVNDFPTRLEPDGERARTDSGGAFLLTPRERGRYVLLVEAGGLALAELGPFRIDPEVGLDGLEVELSEGGAIEGFVRAASGASPAGVIVGISRGDGRPRTQRAGEDGSFRFEHLTPGPWHVSRRAVELVPHESIRTWQERRRAAEIPESCTVREGRTTYHDLDLGGGPASALAGRVTIDGRSPGPWEVQLHRSEGGLAGLGQLGADPVAQTRLSPAGDFRLVAEEPGEHVAILASALEVLSGEELPIALIVEVDLAAGETRLDLALAAAALRVEGLHDAIDPDALGGPTEASASDAAYVYVWEKDRAVAVAFLVPGEDGTARLPFVPAGRARIARIPVARAEELGTDPRAWPAILEFEARAGEPTRLVLP